MGTCKLGVPAAGYPTQARPSDRPSQGRNEAEVYIGKHATIGKR